MAHGLLSPEEDKEAAKQGWGLYHVYELNEKTWTLRILPTEAAELVVNMARNNQTLAQKALGLLTNYKGK